MTDRETSIKTLRGKLSFEQLRKPVLSAFIIYNLIGLSLWKLPQTQLTANLLIPFQGYIEYLGLWHAFRFFAPDPESTNENINVIVRDSAGHARPFFLESLAVPDYAHEAICARLRKFKLLMCWHGGAMLRPHFAGFVARRCADSGNFKPAAVSIVMTAASIRPPAPGIGQAVAPDRRETIIDYLVKQSDLQ